MKPDAFDIAAAKPLKALLPLDALGYQDNGLYWYAAELPRRTAPVKYKIRLYSGDGIYVFIDNRIVMTQLETHTGGYEYEFEAPATPNGATLTILYEASGRRNGDAPMWEPRGLAQIYTSTPDGGKEYLSGFKFLPGITGVKNKWFAPSLDDSAWRKTSPGDWKKAAGLKDYDGFVWYRAEFSLPKTPGWEIPIGLKIKASDYALVYVNGKFIGRYWSAGPQETFYMPACWLKFGDKGKNEVAIAVINNGGPGGLMSLEVAPYSDFVARDTQIEVSLE